MNWPNKVSLNASQVTRATSGEFWYKHDVCVKWCQDTLSSRSVLWDYDVHSLNTDEWAFYFAQPQDAVLFRLTHGI